MISRIFILNTIQRQMKQNNSLTLTWGLLGRSGPICKLYWLTYYVTKCWIVVSSLTQSVQGDLNGLPTWSLWIFLLIDKVLIYVEHGHPNLGSDLTRCLTICVLYKEYNYGQLLASYITFSSNCYNFFLSVAIYFCNNTSVDLLKLLFDNL